MTIATVAVALLSLNHTPGGSILASIPYFHYSSKIVNYLDESDEFSSNVDIEMD